MNHHKRLRVLEKHRSRGPTPAQIEMAAAEFDVLVAKFVARCSVEDAAAQFRETGAALGTKTGE